MSDLDRLNNAKVTEDYDDYSEMTTDELLSLEEMMSKTYYTFIVEIINIGAGKGYSVNQVADLLGGERIHRDPVIEPRETLADNSKAKSIMDWTPTTKIEDWIIKYKEQLGL